MARRKTPFLPFGIVVAVVAGLSYTWNVHWIVSSLLVAVAAVLLIVRVGR